MGDFEDSGLIPNDLKLKFDSDGELFEIEDNPLDEIDKVLLTNLSGIQFEKK